ncbi:MAG: LytTR family transcriptional regulator DNA-binding domain-containing protein [Clostridia bacterium]|nr:LytTR family transcriptional regulator DNA-binding domain-containing protein [Clostridia bacterium]
MKKINVRFEQDETLDGVDVVIRARERDAQVDALIEQFSYAELIRLTALDRDGCPTVIDENDVLFISADGKNVQIVTVHGTYHAKQSLQSVEERLNHGFLRISRFEIINLKRVRRYDFTIGGTLRIEFENGMETWASRRYIPIIKEKLSGEEGYLC